MEVLIHQKIRDSYNVTVKDLEMDLPEISKYSNIKEVRDKLSGIEEAYINGDYKNVISPNEEKIDGLKKLKNDDNDPKIKTEKHNHQKMIDNIQKGVTKKFKNSKGKDIDIIKDYISHKPKDKERLIREAKKQGEEKIKKDCDLKIKTIRNGYEEQINNLTRDNEELNTKHLKEKAIYTKILEKYDPLYKETQTKFAHNATQVSSNLSSSISSTIITQTYAKINSADTINDLSSTSSTTTTQVYTLPEETSVNTPAQPTSSISKTATSITQPHIKDLNFNVPNLDSTLPKSSIQLNENLLEKTLKQIPPSDIKVLRNTMANSENRKQEEKHSSTNKQPLYQNKNQKFSPSL
jgi:hypothetical protein